jgi:ABC-type Fe3+-hydroxamate transport system substrate-binding protein
LFAVARALQCCALVTALAAVAGCARDTDPSRDAAAVSAYAEAGQTADSALINNVSVADTSTHDDFGEPLPTDARYAARVVSLNPAFTEISFAIGAGGQFVGRTSWDDRPVEARAVENVGPGIRPNVEAVLATRPTLVLLYATAENRAAADAFKRAGVHTLALRTITIGDFRRAARALGVALGHERAATQLVDSINTTLAAVRAAVAGATRPRVVWPSWEAPVLVVANASYEAELLEIAGAENVFADRDESVAGVTIEEIARRDPELVLAGPERVSMLRAREPWQAIRAVREGRFITLDSMVVGRPGVNLGMAAVSIARALHPDRAHKLP